MSLNLSLDAFPLPTAIVGPDGRFQDVNAVLTRLAGHLLVGESLATWLIGMPDDPAAAAGAAVTLRARSGEVRCRAHTVADADRLVVTVVPTETVGTSTLGADLLNAAVDTSDNCIAVADMQAEDQPIVYVNTGFLRLTGYSPAEALGRNCRFLQRRPDGSFDVETERQRASLDRIREALRSGTPLLGVPLRNYRKDGSLFYNDLSLTPVLDTRGVLTHVIAVQNDVTERVEHEARIRSQYDLIETMLDAMPVPLGLIETDEDGLLAHRLGNAAAADAFGLQTSDAPASSTLDRLGFTDEAGKLWERALRRSGRTGRPVRFEAPRTDARIFEVTVSGLPHDRSLLDGGARRARDAAAGHRDRFFYVAAEVTEGRALADDLLNVTGRQLERVAQDIHDGIGQTLFGAAMLAAALAQSLASADADVAHNAVRLKDILSTALGQLRAFSLGLDPLDIEQIGLSGALDRLAADARALFGIQVVLSVGDDRMPAATAVDLYRIAQEACTNAVRHGRAATVRITLTRSATRIRLTVDDDGAGISDGALAGADGVGLRSMRIRTTRLGGVLQVSRRGDGGTRIRVYLPPVSAS